ncbi:cytochrome p450 domain-containing protein [Ditylenchus destructor]|nr:cytochrome p450 domain-containing protein [Ditylenchus destructor]
MFPLLLFVLVLTLLVYYYFRVSQYPKGPTPWPFVGNMFQLRMDNLPGYLHDMSVKYGPVYTLFMPVPTVVVATYDTIKESLVTKGEHFSGKRWGPLEALMSNNTENGGILTSQGDNWREQRRTAITIFRNFGMGKALMEEQVMRSVEDLVDHINSIEDKSAVNMFLPIQLCVGNVINETLFGHIHKHDNCEEFIGFVESLTEMFNFFQTIPMALYQCFPFLVKVPLINAPYKRIEKRMQTYHNFIKAEVDAQVKEFKPNMPINTFVQAYLQDMEKGNSSWLSVNQLYCVVSDFWMAGMETTSTTLRWAIMYMVKYPEIQNKARQEIDTIVGRDRYPIMQDKLLMPYVSAIVLEIQRYANIVPFIIHTCTSDQTIMGKTIYKDTNMIWHLYSVLAYDPGFEDAHIFRPERFLMEDGKTLRKDVISRMVQFGAGKRQCAGEGLAKMELFLILAALLQKYEFHATSDHVDLTPIISVILMPTDHPCTIVPRD